MSDMVALYLHEQGLLLRQPGVGNASADKRYQGTESKLRPRDGKITPAWRESLRDLLDQRALGMVLEEGKPYGKVFKQLEYLALCNNRFGDAGCATLVAALDGAASVQSQQQATLGSPGGCVRYSPRSHRLRVGA